MPLKRRNYCLINTLILTLVIALAAGWASAVEWKTTNQITIEWDAPTTLIDGAPIPTGAIIKYDIYLANALTDPDKANPVKLTAAPIEALQYTLTLNAEGRYLVGVKAVRMDADGATLAQSETNWSDVNGAMTPNPFGLVHYLAPMAPGNLR
jgi:hypothetical protein